MFSITLDIAECILIAYAIIEIIHLRYTRFFLLHRFIIFYISRKNLKKIIPMGWEIRSLGLPFIKRSKKGFFEVYVQVYNLSDESVWLGDFPIFNKFGKIIETNILEQCSYREKNIPEFKKWKRDILLKELGI